MTRTAFYSALGLLVLAKAQAVAQIITACAPVYNRMPKPCNGQCPACGTMSEVQIKATPYPTTVPPYKPAPHLVRCPHCSNAFYQDALEA